MSSDSSNQQHQFVRAGEFSQMFPHITLNSWLGLFEPQEMKTALLILTGSFSCVTPAYFIKQD